MSSALPPPLNEHQLSTIRAFLRNSFLPSHYSPDSVAPGRARLSPKVVVPPERPARDHTRQVRGSFSSARRSSVTGPSLS